MKRVELYFPFCHCGIYEDFPPRVGPVDLTQYFVQNISLASVKVNQDVDSVSLNLVFGRRVMSVLFTTYLPTLLLCLVCFATNHFKCFYFEAIVTVNLTSLLVLTTLFISISESLPKTAYVKMIDVWSIFNLFVPFLEVVLQVKASSHEVTTWAIFRTGGS